MKSSSASDSGGDMTDLPTTTRLICQPPRRKSCFTHYASKRREQIYVASNTLKILHMTSYQKRPHSCKS
ncbi:unnamed protein product, partial [Brassica oleracea]